MSRKFAPIWVLSIVVVLALAGVGVAYGIWQQTLFVNGTVETGEAEAELSVVEVYTEGDIKGIASCNADVIETLDEYDTLVITATNMFPGVSCDVVFDVTSVGSVPIHIHRPVIAPGYDTQAIAIALSDCYTQETQLHLGNSAECELDIDVLQTADNDEATYSFSATILVHQYNIEP